MKHIWKSHRFWVLWVFSLFVIAWYFFNDPDGGAETVGRIQYASWLFIFAGPVYLIRKALLPGSSKAAWSDVQKGSIAAGLWSVAAAILMGILFLAFSSIAHANEPPKQSIQYLPVLQNEINSQWPDAPSRAIFAAQVEQETCPSLTSKKCWNPKTELKTDRENGFGLGQLTVTAKFDNFAEARKLDITLRDWQWKDRFDPAKQLRTMVLMDKTGYKRLSPILNPKERVAMAFSAYNGGYGGVQADRRVCANVAGCDPNRWFDNVELHSLKAKTAVKGYGQSFFQINRGYVRNIMGVRREHYAVWFKEV